MAVAIPDAEVAQSPRLVHRATQDLDTGCLELREQPIEVVTDVNPEIGPVSSRAATLEWHQPKPNRTGVRTIATRHARMNWRIAGNEIDLEAEAAVVRDGCIHILDLQHGLNAVKLMLVCSSGDTLRSYTTARASIPAWHASPSR